eukprot:4257745-Pyramimonas_sp.AAC.1
MLRRLALLLPVSRMALLWLALLCHVNHWLCPLSATRGPPPSPARLRGRGRAIALCCRARRHARQRPPRARARQLAQRKLAPTATAATRKTTAHPSRA